MSDKKDELGAMMFFGIPTASMQKVAEIMNAMRLAHGTDKNEAPMMSTGIFMVLLEHDELQDRNVIYGGYWWEGGEQYFGERLMTGVQEMFSQARKEQGGTEPCDIALRVDLGKAKN